LIALSTLYLIITVEKRRSSRQHQAKKYLKSDPKIPAHAMSKLNLLSISY